MTVAGVADTGAPPGGGGPREPRAPPRWVRLDRQLGQQRTSRPVRAEQVLLARSLAAFGSVGVLCVRWTVVVSEPRASSWVRATNVAVALAPDASEAVSQLTVR